VLKLERVCVCFFLGLLQHAATANKINQPGIVLRLPEELLALGTVGGHWVLSFAKMSTAMMTGAGMMLSFIWRYIQGL